MRIERILFLFLLSACFCTGYGQEIPRTDTLGVDVYYRRGFSVLEDSLRDNGVRLTSFADRLRALQQDTSHCIRQVRIVSGTSPEGTAKANRRLAYNRSERIRHYLNHHFPSWNLSFDIRSEAEDWSGLAALVAASDMPARDEVLDILHNTPVWVFENGRIVDGRKRQLGMLQGGRPWRYMEERFFPELRCSKVRVVYENIATPAPEPAPAVPEPAQETARPKDPVA